MRIFKQLGTLVTFLGLSQLIHADSGKKADYYPVNFNESRARFLKAQESIKLRLKDIVHIDRFEVPEKKGEGLFTDFLYLDCREYGQKHQPLLVMTSGVHGLEAKVGTAAQIWFLENEAVKKCKQGFSQVYFHALNPFGFHHDRRFTVNNVDLNRNFPTNPDMFGRENEAYSAMESILNPKKPVGLLPLRSFSLFKKLVGKLIGGFSSADIRQASVGGQYQYPQGIYFGGVRPEPVVAFVKEKLQKVFSLYEDEDVLHYDFHTGLGKKGVLHMIVGPSLSDYGQKKLDEVFKPLSTGRFEMTTANDPGFYQVEGDIIDFVSSLKSDGKIVSFTVEYGTVGLGLFSQLKTLTRLVNENQGYFHGHKNARVKSKVKERVRDVFHPPKEKWLTKVKRTNEYLLTEVLESFMASLK